LLLIPSKIVVLIPIYNLRRKTPHMKIICIPKDL
jgi:hypothetical protein